MTESFNEFFEENTQWVEGNATVPAAMPPEPPKSRREMRQRRQQYKRKHWLIIIAAVLVIALVVAGCFLGYRKIKAVRAANERNTSIIEDYPGPGTGSVQFTVASGELPTQIAENLVKEGVVKSAEAFTSSVTESTNLYPGTFELKKRMRGADVVRILSDPSNATGFLDVKPGQRLSAVIAEAAELSGLDVSDFQTIVDGDGSGILPAEADGSFEGWLEPGQYDVKGLGDASAILKAMVDKRIAKLDELGVPTGEDRERIIKIASIAEAEVNKAEYYAKVTRVIENRLDKGMQLGMDSTVAYGNNVPSAKVTTAMTKDAKNPYNSYVQFGLPPTPISSPGDNAIKAALEPENGDWLYFATVNLETGETKFAATAAEHDKNVAELRKWQEEHQQ